MRGSWREGKRKRVEETEKGKEKALPMVPGAPPIF